MAVVFEGFSIREYAAKMRSVDVVKCWPFSGGTDEIVNKEDIDRLLPPITVTKFRWWSHELDLLRSSNNSNSSSVVNAEAEEDNKLVEEEEEEEEKLDMVCPVCRVFTAATVNALNAHIDSCLVQASREERRRMRLAIKAKSRPPKKRSIVEIFAESRQIDKLDVNDDNLDKVDGQQHELDCSDVEFNSKIVKKKKKKMKKVKILNKFMHNKKKLKNKSLKNKLITNNKENPNKLKLQTPVKFKRKVNDSVCNKGLAKGILDSVIIHRKKQDLKHKSLRKRHRIVKTTKLVTENQESVVPVRGILKNHKRDVLVQNASICRVQTGSEVNPCDIHHSDRHVRFSGKDDILGPSKRNVSSFENNICRLYSDSITSSEKDRSTESEDQLATLNGINGDVVSISLEQETVVQPLIEKDLFPCSHASVDIPNFQRPHKIPQEKLKNFSDKSVDNLCMFDRSNHLTSYGPSYADTQLLSALNKVSNPCVNPQFHGSVSKASNSSARFIDHFENSSHGVAEMSSMANMRQISQPLSTAFTLDESAELRLPSPAENMTGHGMQFPPCTDLSTVEFRSSLCPFPEWNQRAVSFRQNCMSEEFFGLPLNSQGELIQASSNGKGCYSQLNKSNLEAGSSSGFPVLNHELQRNMGDCSSSLKERRYVERFFPKDQLNLFPGENYVKENPNLHLPARLGVAESPVTTEDVHRINSRTGSSHYIPLLDSEQNLKNISFDRFRQYDQAQNQDGIGVDHPKENSDQMLLNTTQLTMRLMGKDVAIGRSSKEMQGFRDGQVWTDKEIISEHCTSSTGPENLSVKSHFQNWLKPASGKLNQPLEIHSSQASQSNPLMRGPDSRFFHPYGNWKTNTVFENGIHPVNRNHSSKLHTIANPLPLQEMLNWTGNLQETFIPGPDTSSVSSHAGSAPHINSQLRDWSPAGFPYKQNQPQVTKSAFSFPFLHSDHVEPVQQSWFQSSSKSLVPWLLQTKQVKAPASVPFAGFDGKYYPHSTEPNLPVIPSFHQSPVAYPYNFMTSQTPMQSSLGPVALVYPSFVSAHSGTQPISSINKNYRNRNRAKNRMQSKALGIKSLNHCQKTKKMPASIDGYSTNAAKISNLVQEDSSAVMEFTREDYGGNIRCNAGASETNFYKDRASSSGCDPLEVQEDVYSMTGLASGGNFIQDIQYNGGSLKLNSDCVGASSVGCAPNESLNFGVRTSLVYDSSKVDGIGRSGPIKLSAGAKHILKPSQNMDQDNSRLVHSTIPFATAPDSAYLRESQKKSTKSTAREIKRLDSITRSPVYAQFSEALNGVSTIRAYKAYDRMADINGKSMDNNIRFTLVNMSANRWLAIRLETLGGLMIWFTATFAVMQNGGAENQEEFASTMGLLLSYALNITGLLTGVLRLASLAENSLNAIERVGTYIDLPSEAPPVIETNRPPPGWPSSGSIKFEDVVLRYRPELPPVLHGLSFTVEPSNKVGIVGRTGAGKSSMINALFRIVELERGRILIDGCDIGKFGLEDLRKVLGIIPQSPVLFSGTVRFNLDPFSEHNDADLWEALERAHLKDAIRRNSLGLDAEVSEAGENFSVGQRQLLSLARALLRRSKILVLDEATAAVDVRTDALIQKTIREEFKSCTMLIIAHRLNTVIDCDRILLLDSGRVLEYDSPEQLLLNEESAFSKMVQSTGAANAQYLRSLVLDEGENRLGQEENKRLDGQRRWLASSRWAAAAQFALAVSLTSSQNDLQRLEILDENSILMKSKNAVITLQRVLEGKHNQEIEESLKQYEVSSDGWWSALYRMIEGLAVMSRLARNRLNESEFDIQERSINWDNVEM